MEFLLFYAISILFTKLMIDANYFLTIKRIAKDKYTFIKDEFDCAYDVFFTPGKGLDIILKLVPFINLFYGLAYTKISVDNYDCFVDIIKEYNVLEPMTNEEIEQFNSKPTSITALKINRNHEKIIKKSQSMLLYDGSIIFYEYLGNKEIKIFRTMGPISECDSITINKRIKHILDILDTLYNQLYNDGNIDDVLKNTKMWDFAAWNINDEEITTEELKLCSNNNLNTLNDINIQNVDNDLNVDKPLSLKRTINKKRKK